MLYYVAIDKSEGLDCSEGQDCVRNTALKSRQCTSCRFYFYIRNNYRYEKTVCDGCFQGIDYEKKNYTMIFRILETKKGTYRTNSSYFLHEVEELPKQSDLNEKFGWLFKEKSNLEIEHEDKILEQCS